MSGVTEGVVRVNVLLIFGAGGRQLVSLEPPDWLCTIPPGISAIELVGVERVTGDESAGR